MTIRLVHYSDVENACDDPVRMGQLVGTVRSLDDDRTVVAGTGDNTAPGVLAHHFDGRQSLDFFQAIDPDVETFGNHDFDFGPDPLRETVADSPQEWITANVYAEHDPDGPRRRFADCSPTTVVRRGDRRVGFVGVTDPATPDIAAGAAELTVTDPVAAVRQAVTELDGRADHVVVLSHLRSDLEDDVAAVEGVDAVLGGHVHRERDEVVEGTPVVRPGANGQVVWELELPDGDSAPTATRHETSEGPLDESVADAVRDRMADVGLQDIVDTVEEPIHRDVERRYTGECRVGNLVADAYRWAVDADVGFVHNGGLREGRPLVGEVTAGEVASVAPFGGQVHRLDVDGDRLRTLVESVFHPDRDDDFICHGHVSGLEVTYDPHAGRIEAIRFDGEPVDDGREYSLATNAYVAFSDAFPVSSDAIVDSFGLQFEVPVEYAREKGIDVGIDGRLSEV